MSESKTEVISRYKHLRERIVDKLLDAVVWGAGGLIIWALVTAFSLDAKIERETAKFEKQIESLRAEMIDAQNAAVQREAKLRDELAKWGRGGPSLKVGEVAPNPPELDPSQTPIQFLEQHTKRYVKE